MEHGNRPAPPGYSPVRYPDGLPARTRSKRAFFLLLLTLIVPGGAQVVAGNRKLGRFALGVTVACWIACAALLVVGLVNRGFLIDLAARPGTQVAAAALMGLFAAWWLFLFLNTLYLIRPGRLAPGMQAIIAAATVLLVLATSGVLGYGTYVLNTGRETIQDVFASGPAFEPIDGRYNFLVMGGDAGPNRTGLRPDSMSIFSVDASSGKTAVISMPRNFQNAQFPDDSPMKKIYPDGFNCGDECILNALYPTVEAQYAGLYPDAENPGAQAMMEAAEGITGVEIQAYVLIDMAGFKDLIDAMGGVTVQSGGWVPYRGEPRQDTPIRTRWWAPGRLTLSGEEALWYARSRYFSTDYNRIRRQQCLQQAMVNQFNPQTLLTRFSQIMSAGKRVMETNIPQNQLGSFINLADDARKTPFERLTLGAPDFGTAADRFSTYPDFGLIHTRVDGLLAQASEDAPASPSPDAPGGSSASGGSGAGSGSSGPSATKSSGGSPSSSGGGGAKASVPSTQPDGSPITEDYLIQLEALGAVGTLEQIASTNDECSAK